MTGLDTGLEIAGLSAGFGSSRVLFDVSLCVRAGSLTLLTGPNGAGKTTLLLTVLGRTDCSGGSIRVDGADITTRSPTARLRDLVGWVPEGRALFPTLTVLENLRVAALAWGTPRREVTGKVDALLERFPIVAGKVDARLSTLSGGQQQAVAIARCFIGGPRLLLLDEPSTGLAPVAWHDVLATCRAAAETGTAVLVVEQRLLDTLRSVDRVALMVRGRIVQEHRADDPAVADAAMRADYFSTGGAP